MLLYRLMQIEKKHSDELQRKEKSSRVQYKLWYFRSENNFPFNVLIRSPK